MVGIDRASRVPRSCLLLSALVIALGILGNIAAKILF